MRGLIIKQPWIDHTLNESKPFEIRSRPTKIRERIGLICAGTGEVWGEADIVGCKESSGTFPDNKLRYCAFGTLCDYMNERHPNGAYFWILSNIVRYDKPRRYKHPQGAQVWVKCLNFERMED